MTPPRRPPAPGRALAALAACLAGGAAVASLCACRGVAVPGSTGPAPSSPPAPPPQTFPYAVSPMLPGEPLLSALSLRWASTEYFLGGPGDPVIELRVIVDNHDPRGRNTDSTTILWEPSFVQRTTFLSSDPPAWRVRVDERGWGVLDTAGVLGRQYGTFHLWFVIDTYAVYEPRVMVVANGHIVLQEVTAGASNRRRAGPAPAQTAFEQGTLAGVADAAGPLPNDERGAFPLATGMGLLLAGVAVAGGAAAFRLAAARGPRS